MHHIRFLQELQTGSDSYGLHCQRRMNNYGEMSCFSGYHYNQNEAVYAQSSFLRLLERSFPGGSVRLKGCIITHLGNWNCHKLTKDKTKNNYCL